MKNKLLSLILFSFTSSAIHAGLISEDFNAGLPSGATLYGNASIVNNEAVLTPDANSQHGALSFTDQDSGAAINNWSAAFDFRLDQGNGTGGADGISLSYSRLGNVGLSGLSHGVGEEGTNTGIAVGFDTWNNGGIDNNSGNHLSLRYGGALLALTNIPTSTFFLNDGVTRNTMVTMSNGLLDVSINGTSFINHNIVGWSAYAGQFNFAGRTGGARNRQAIDNFIGTTTTNQVPEPNPLLLMSLGLFAFAYSRKKK